MKQSILKAILPVALFSLCFAVSSAQAATSVGKAIISIGKVVTVSQDGAEKKLKRRGKVYEGDTIKVGNKSRVQLRFVDNQLVVLKANTVFRIDEYKFKDKNDKDKSAALSLLKGGMRSITGVIGKKPSDKYKVKTPVATMGVRGTHYVIQICDGNCGEGIQGIVGTVLEGQIVMGNDGGSQTFGTDQFFNVPSQDEPPKTITNPPTVLISRATTSNGDDVPVDGDGSTEGDGDTLVIDDTVVFTAGEEPLTTTTGTIDPAAPVTFIQGTAAPNGALIALAGISPGIDGAGGTVGQEGNNALIDIATINMVGNQPVSAFILDPMGSAAFAVITGSVATEIGGDGMLGVNWGRWNNGTFDFKDDGVTTSLLDPGFAFVYSDNDTLPSTLTTFMSTNTYNLTAGPSIRDESGAIVSGSVNFTADFSTQSITAFGGTLAGNGRTYTGLNLISPVSFTALASGTELDLGGLCTGGICSAGLSLTGTAGVGFVGPGAEGAIGYFGLNDATGTVGVSGAGLFTAATPPM